MWYRVKCLWHGTSVRQHYDSELSVTTRHRSDMTEKLLKVKLNPNKQTNKQKLKLKPPSLNGRSGLVQSARTDESSKLQRP